MERVIGMKCSYDFSREKALGFYMDRGDRVWIRWFCPYCEHRHDDEEIHFGVQPCEACGKEVEVLDIEDE